MVYVYELDVETVVTRVGDVVVHASQHSLLLPDPDGCLRTRAWILVLLAAQAMRRILVDHARLRGRAKRGSNAPRVAVETADPAAAAGAVDHEDAVALDIALDKLQAIDPGQTRIVELRFFGGLTVEQIAQLLATSPSTVKREWALARAWLHRELAGTRSDGDE